MKWNYMDIVCERCGGIARLTSNAKNEEIISCCFCGLNYGHKLIGDKLKQFEMNGFGYYQITTIDNNIECNIIPKDELDDCLKLFKKLLNHPKVKKEGTYLSVYDEENNTYKVLLGDIGLYNTQILEQWKKADKILKNNYYTNYTISKEEPRKLDAKA